MEVRRCFSIDNLCAAVMARAVLDDFAAGRLRGLTPPPAYRIAKRLGVRTVHIQELFAGRPERVGTTALKKIAGRFGCSLGTAHGVPVVVPTGADLPDVPDLGRAAKPISPQEALARARARDAERVERETAMGRAQFSQNMKGAGT